MPCSGYPSETCGGDLVLTVFEITSLGEEVTGTPAPTTTTTPEVRVEGNSAVALGRSVDFIARRVAQEQLSDGTLTRLETGESGDSLVSPTQKKVMYKYIYR